MAEACRCFTDLPPGTTNLQLSGSNIFMSLGVKFFSNHNTFCLDKHNFKTHIKAISTHLWKRAELKLICFDTKT